MKDSLLREFHPSKPRALVLDDHRNSRDSLRLALTNRGFDVEVCASVAEFRNTWKPGTFDVIIADWELSAKDRGDKVLGEVRSVDWDVPFVLLSGKLDDTTSRIEVLQSLLHRGPSEFIVRGHDSVKKVGDAAEALMDRRDIALLRMILALRPAALAGRTLTTSAGKISVQQQLAEVVATPAASHEAARPLQDSWQRKRRRERTP